MQANIQQIKKNLKESKVKKDIKKLKEIKKFLNEKKLIIKTDDQNKTKWSAILDNSYFLDFGKIRDSVKSKQLIQNFLQAYELTSKILQELKLIKPVTNILSFIDDEYNLVRLENITFKADHFYLNPQDISKGEGYGLRFKEAAFKEEIEAAKQKSSYQQINNHFQNFIKPFRDYEQNNATGWKINKGVLSETFQRHWENFHINYIEGASLGDDFESVGRRWWMYRESSGSDPYFTGPDTNIAQMKNVNASLVSNLNTVLNSIEGVLALTDEKLLAEKGQENIRKIFTQAPLKPTLNKKLKYLPEDVKRLIFEEAEKIFGEANVRFT